MRRGLGRAGFFVAAGLLSGALILALLCAADYLVHIPDRTEALHSQENLESALCVDEGFDRVAVLTVYPGTEEDAQGSFAFNDIRWYKLGREGTRLELPPGDYTVSAAASTRVSETGVTLNAGEETVLTLTAADAPRCPEFLVLEGRGNTNERFPLPFASGCEAELFGEVEGIFLQKTGEEWSLVADASIGGGYYPFLLILKNSGGRAIVYMALNIPLPGEEKAIETVSDLLAMREEPGGRYYLAHDIDLSEFGSWTQLFSQEEPFTGSFDGRGNEIRGLNISISDETGNNSFLGWLKNAQVRNLIIRAPIAQGQAPGANMPSAAALVQYSDASLIENCAVIDGTMAAGGVCAGVANNAENSHLIGLFNSADVFTAGSAILPNTGGVVGASSSSYFAYCANEGDMQGHHLTGGISGFATGSAFRYCVNSGQIRGIHLAATFLPGGIIQSAGGGSKSDCLFVRGQSALGAGGGGPVFRIGGITWQQLRDVTALTMLGSFSGDDARWGFASKDAQGPVPLGIFPDTSDVPEIILQENGQLLVPEKEGTAYHYTLDGSDPRGYGIETGTLSIRLQKNQTLAVLASKEGSYDSEIVYYGR